MSPMQPILSSPAHVCISTHMSYVRPRLLLTARNMPHFHQPTTHAASRGRAMPCPARDSQHAARLACVRATRTEPRSLLGVVAIDSVRHHGQAVGSLGQPRFVTSAAPFPFPDWRRLPLVPVSCQVPEHPAALPHWPSLLAHITIGEHSSSAPSTWFRCQGELLAHPRHPGTAMVRERREIFLRLSQRWGDGTL